MGGGRRRGRGKEKWELCVREFRGGRGGGGGGGDGDISKAFFIIIYDFFLYFGRRASTLIRSKRNGGDIPRENPVKNSSVIRSL